MIDLTVNGKPRQIEEAQSIAELLVFYGINPLLVAVEHNGEIVRRERFGEVMLGQEDTLEIIHAVGGGA